LSARTAGTRRRRASSSSRPRPRIGVDAAHAREDDDSPRALAVVTTAHRGRAADDAKYFDAPHRGANMEVRDARRVRRTPSSDDGITSARHET
jgi:hypothetical protein